MQRSGAFLLRTLTYVTCIIQIMNTSYSLNPVCPKIYFGLASFSKTRSLNFPDFTVCHETSQVGLALKDKDMLLSVMPL